MSAGDPTEGQIPLHAPGGIVLTRTTCDIHSTPCDNTDDHVFIGAPEKSDSQPTDSIVYYGKHSSKIKIGYLIDSHAKECPHRECTLLGAQGYDAYDLPGYHLGHAGTIEETVRLYSSR